MKMKALEHKKSARDHILQVTHTRAQLAIGKGRLEVYHEVVLCCFQDRGGLYEQALRCEPRRRREHLQHAGPLAPSSSSRSQGFLFISSAFACCPFNQVKAEQLHVAVVVDFTKLGTLSTVQLNQHFTLLAKILARNQQCSSAQCVVSTRQSANPGSAGLIIAPLLAGTAGGGSLRKDLRHGGWVSWSLCLLGREIENKADQLGIALRDVRLAIDPSELHGNSERPCYFQAWLAVADCTLPAKGVGFRRNAHDSEKDLKNLVINTFTASDLWRLGGFNMDQVPKAAAEADFCVPSAKSFLQCADSRRNLTDAQETGQWVSGEPVFSQILASLMGFLV